MIHDFVHISDLHVGRDAETDRAAERLCASLLARPGSQVLLTGDLTHRGRREELSRFEAIFAPLLEQQRLILVPGNHDRMGDDYGPDLMARARVDVVSRPGLHVVRLDSTAPHNRSPIASHGRVTPSDIEAVSAAFDEAPRNALAVLMLHHHVLPLPEDRFAEKLSNMLGWPYAAELHSGRELVERLAGRCDLVLHGHRHKARELDLGPRKGRPLQIYNAGSSGVLGWVRQVIHRAGQVLSSTWIETGQPDLIPFPATVSARPAGSEAIGRGAAASPLTVP